MRVDRWLRARVERRAAILLYHRVAELDVDPWGLAVRPSHFDEHLAVIRSRASALSLSELTHRLATGTMPRRAIVVTFDDGYADNLRVAKPILQRHDIPATFFITTGPLTGDAEFWWDELESLLLANDSLQTTPSTLEVEIDGQSCGWKLDGTVGGATDEGQHRHWRAWDTPRTSRQAAFVELWKRLQSLHEPARRAVLDRLAAWAGRDGVPSPHHRTLSIDELRELARDPLVEIGAHTVTHSRLSALDNSEQRLELRASRRHLEDLLDRPVTTMSYPFGGPEDYTADTVWLAREAGFSCACAGVSGPVRQGADLFTLPRCFVPDVDGDRFDAMLHDWFEAA